MAWELTPYVPLLSMGGVALSVLAGALVRISWDDRTTGERTAIAFVLLVTLLAFEHVVQLVAPESVTTPFVFGVEFVTIALAVPAWFAYSLWYTGRTDWLTRRFYTVFGGATSLFSVLVATNPVHHLFWHLAPGHPPALVYGPGLYAFVLYAAVATVVGTVFVGNVTVQARGAYRFQPAFLFVASAIPAVVTLTTVVQGSLEHGGTFVVVAAFLTAVACGVSVLQFRWFDRLPVPRDRTFDALAALDTTDGRRTFDATATEDDREEDGLSNHVVFLFDVTDRKEAESRLSTQRERITLLHGVARELAAACDEAAVQERTVESVRNVLDADWCLFTTVEDGALRVLTASGDAPPNPLPAFSTESAAAGRTSMTGVSSVVDDLTDTRTTGEPVSGRIGRRARSMLTVAAGESGVVQAFTTEPSAFDDDDLELAELLASHVTTALDRIHAETTVRAERDRLEEFAGVVSHDLRNPLNVAQGRLELLSQELPPDPGATAGGETADPVRSGASGRAREHVETIERAHNRMESLVEDVLTLAQQGRAIGETEPVDIGSLTRGVWRDLDASAANLVVDRGIGTVDADADRLRELLTNLLQNAVDHVGPNVTVTVGPLDGGGFYVADDGVGIPPAERERVFEHGFTTARDGVGFGLAIVERIADAHGWNVRITDAETGGARFEFETS